MKHIVILLLLMIVPAAVMAQHKNNRAKVEKELQDFKIKYLAQEMELRADQQAKFVEVYSRKMNEIRKIYETPMKLQHKVKHNKKATPEEYQKASDMMSDAKVQEGKVDRKYDEEFKKFLSSKQIYKMKQAEGEFRKKLQELRSKRK